MSGKYFESNICRGFSLKTTFCLIALGFCVLAPVQQLSAAEVHQHGAHVHGIATLNVALDGHDLYMELESPAANIVGFEHEPKNDAQAQQLHDALELLESAEKMVSLPVVAECMAGATHLAGEETREHDHDTGHHDDDGEEKAEDSHGEHSDHSDISVTYQFHCENPEKLESIGVRLFEHYPGFEKINVQLLTSKKQTAVTLTPDMFTISF